MKTNWILCLAASALCACASFEEHAVEHNKANESIYAPKVPAHALSSSGKTGDMAYVVEKLAKASGCEVNEGASLLARRPGIQFYRVPCADGQQVLYKCELRQCKIAE
jgi:hypothetical protein